MLIKNLWEETNMKKKLVLIGNGMAGVRCIEQVIKLNPNKFQVTIFGSEPHPNYNRIMLSSVLAGDAEMKDIVINDWDWYEDNNITFYPGETVVSIDTQKQTISSDKARTVAYDELIIATGSLPFMLPIPGADKEGVIAFRDIKDCEAMVDASKKYKKAIVIGGGLLGIEAARGLLNLKMDVSVVHISSYLMERQLDETAARMLQRELENQGMRFLLERNSESIIGRKRVSGLRFKDGTEEPADLIVMAVGIKPNIEVAKLAGVGINRGIVVNDVLATNIPHVYAVGECAEHRGVAYGLVAPLYDQGLVLARNLCGVEGDTYQGSILSTKLKVSGVEVFSAGQFTDDASTRSVRVQDDFTGIYKKVLIREGKIVGAVLFGDNTDSSYLFKLIRTGEDVTGREKTIVLGESSGAKAGGVSIADMPDDEQICGCNGVSKGTIVQAIKERGLNSVDGVRACTKASGGCGSCKPLVADILKFVLGDEAAEEKSGICTCTELGRDEIVAAIRNMELSTSKEVRHVLGWSNPEGCSKCRPALNYYLGMVWPEEHVEERESRFVNERNHANIQKDGTYSVVPRIYGGVTSPKELKRIAEVAEKYDVPLVKITGGQRLDLFGVKKEDLPSMWEDLDMPSGYAYGKALRTVKTCVGSTFCRFGTQDAMGMGIQLEKKFERLNTPAKVKMAVSGCPRNCAEATIKDVGVVAVDNGWEIFVAGNGGAKVRESELLVKVRTDEEVMEYSAAYLQYYRENANYNERTAPWVERVGLDSIKAALETPEQRKALIERIDHALSLLVDPWKEAIEEKSVRAQYEAVPVPTSVQG
jgi:nitrite reductase (NADH) large subunit